MSSATHMSTFFAGSGLLEQRSGGHGIQSVVSKCTLKHINTYLETGKVPQGKVVCEPDEKPLVGGVMKREVRIGARALR